MRIIKGTFKRRNLSVPPNIRPTSLRIKKGLFDLLADEVTGRFVLDVFAGSGSLGIEALSLGAEYVEFVDIKKACVKVIRENLTLLGCSNKASITFKDAYGAIKDFANKNKRFGIVLIDPPYYGGLAKKALLTLDEYDIVSPCGYVVMLCSHKEDYNQEHKLFSLIVHKHYGQSTLLIYRKHE